MAMDRVAAIRNLIADERKYSRGEGRSTTSAKRTVQALRVLSLTKGEVVRVMHALDYCDENGEPYPSSYYAKGRAIKRIW